MLEIISKSKSLVFTGHSVGGTIASLSAIWFLSHLQSIAYPFTVICITYGSPMLGNESFSRAILQERWGGNFFHVVAQHDLVPRLLFAPSVPIIPHLPTLVHFWHLAMRSPYYKQFANQISEEKNAQLFRIVLQSLEEALKSIGAENSEENLFWPFGNYIFCSSKGSICLENSIAVIKFLFLMLLKASPSSSIEDHLNYENYVSRVCWQILSTRSFIDGNLPESSYEAGIMLALQASDTSSSVSLHTNKLSLIQLILLRKKVLVKSFLHVKYLIFALFLPYALLEALYFRWIETFIYPNLVHLGKGLKHILF